MKELATKKIDWTDLEEKIEISSAEEKIFYLNNFKDSEIILKEQGKLKILALIDLSQSSLKSHMRFSLAGVGADLEVIIILIGRGKNKLNLKTSCEHLARHTKAEFQVKAIMFEESELDYSGKISIPASGQQTDTNLRCQTLLLSEKAKAITVPSLEIVANDVKASHAASIGKVDEEILFYLESRGFDRESALKLMIEGFIKEALEELSIEQKEILWQDIVDKLPIKL